ncbi:hypothetical protein [Gimesia algae]|nr:hypothetical protein [Gimesia algae]
MSELLLLSGRINNQFPIYCNVKPKAMSAACSANLKKMILFESGAMLA